MIKPTSKHTNSIHQSIKLLENAQSSAIDPKFKKALQRDIKLHQEVLKMLWHLIENPTLPFIDDRVGHEKDPVDQLLDVASKLLSPIEDEPDTAF